MYINRVALDYLRITTYNKELFWQMESFYSSRGWERSSSRVMQYTGVAYTNPSGGTAVFSDGRQGIERHFMVTFTGEEADRAIKDIVPLLARSEWNCSRIDLQTTVPVEEGQYWHLPNQFYLMVMAEQRAFYSGRGGTVGVKLIRSTTDTLYIGSRTSDQMIRYYVKRSEDGKTFVRWEWELKGKRAKWAMHEIVSGGQSALPNVFYTLASRVRGTFSTFSEPHIEIATNYSDGAILGGYSKRAITRDTMQYLESLTGTIYRVMTSHSTRQRAIAWVKLLCEMTDALDD